MYVACDRQFLSIAEASKLIGYSESSIRRRIRDGSLPSRQPAGRKGKLFIPKEALLRLQGSGETTDSALEYPESIAANADSDRSQRLPGRKPNWQQSANR